MRKKSLEREKTKERANQPDARMIHTYGQENTATKGVVIG